MRLFVGLPAAPSVLADRRHRNSAIEVADAAYPYPLYVMFEYSVQQTDFPLLGTYHIWPSKDRAQAIGLLDELRSLPTVIDKTIFLHLF